MAEKFYTVHIQIAGEPQTGIWCSECSLPARVRFDLVGISPTGVSPWGSIERCLHCEGYDDHEDDE